MKYPKLRHLTIRVDGRTMENAKRNAIRALERRMSWDGGWNLVQISDHEFPGSAYGMKTDSYSLDAWLVQYPKGWPGRST